MTRPQPSGRGFSFSRYHAATKRLLPFALALASFKAYATDWPQFGFDATHSGNNSAETVLSPRTVGGLRLLYSVSLPAPTDTAPIYLAAVATPQGTHDLVYVATGNGVVAFDASSGATVWTEQPAGNYTGASVVAGSDRQYLYATGSDGKVHKIWAYNGNEFYTNVWPASVTLKPARERLAASLAVTLARNGRPYLYALTSSFGDGSGYQGHVVAFDLLTDQNRVFNALCSNSAFLFIPNGTLGSTDCADFGAGMWARAGVTYDAVSDRIFMTTGNGPFNANIGGHDWGDSVLALNADGSAAAGGMPLDSYTPTEFAQFAAPDTDLGTSAPALLPPVSGSTHTHLAVQVGKDGVVRLLDRDRLSGNSGPGFAGGELQALQQETYLNDIATPQPAVWVDSGGDGATWVFATTITHLWAFKLSVANGMPQLGLQWSQASTMWDSSSPVVANGVLYLVGCGNSPCLQALDPRSGTELWTSATLPSCCHWQSPIVVDGRVFMTTRDSLLMFALNAIFKDGFEGQ